MPKVTLLGVTEPGSKTRHSEARVLNFVTQYCLSGRHRETNICTALILVPQWDGTPNGS